MGGPIRANFASKMNEKRDFVDFVRNFGRSQSKGLEGGTYGLGKGVLYESSDVGMCLVYSQALVDGAIENRLIGVSGGDEDYDDNNLKYTGRNWWGIIAEDEIVDPATGTDARLIAETVGMPVPEPDESGTCIMIIDPKRFDGDRGDAHIQDRINAIRDAALKWAWPHAMDVGSGPNVEFSFTFDGAALAPIRPLEDPMIRHFAQGYVDMMRSNETGIDPQSAQTILKPIDSQRPQKHLGALVLRQALHQLGDVRSLENTVALLRKPRMVVKYLPVTAPAGDFSVYSVFVADDSVDKFFASSEPVAHDDWVVMKAEKDGRRNYVRSAMLSIDAVFKSLYSDSTAATASQRVAGATRISSALGGLITGIKGQGARSIEPQAGSGLPSPGSSISSRRTTIRPSGPAKLFKFGGNNRVGFPFVISGGKPKEKFSVTAHAHIVLGTGGVESNDGPLMAARPEFVGWIVDGDDELVETLIVETPTEASYLAIFTQPADTAVSSTASLEVVAP
ncbi:hypothetical protein CVV68_18595 [Arthrobacter livingstonensis]|uniref:Uncharacterized protein n=1 Tax=Arthrobacter livingstonensis TaxID=670078 RepID=A0A2V5L279_9MICC|nr:hypothetical protein CVV68_18595 [Arthrobacter livingstonensis]